MVAAGSPSPLAQVLAGCCVLASTTSCSVTLAGAPVIALCCLFLFAVLLLPAYSVYMYCKCVSHSVASWPPYKHSIETGASGILLQQLLHWPSALYAQHMAGLRCMRTTTNSTFSHLLQERLAVTRRVYQQLFRSLVGRLAA